MTQPTDTIAQREPRKTCYFWKIPQEILDQIFELAYGIDAPKTVAFRSCKREHRSNELVRPFASSLKVNEFLVSKDFFLNAARAWIGAQTWSAQWYHERKLLQEPLIFQFLSHIRITDWGWYDLDRIQHWTRYRERSLSMEIENGALCCEHDGWDAGSGHTTQCLETLPLVQDLRRYCRLKKLTLVLRGELAAFDPSAKKDVEANVTAASGPELIPFVTKAPGDPIPLYTGSRVTYDTDCLLPADYYSHEPYRRFEVDERYLESARAFEEGGGSVVRGRQGG